MSEAAATHCPTCNASNPMGAKFCSACRAPLSATAPPPNVNVPPPPPPPRPGIGGMMGQMGGKAVTRQINGDAAAIYAALTSHIRGLPSTELQHEVPPRQISAKVAYKDLVSTGGIVIAVDTSVSIAPTAAGQSQVSVTTKTDMSSTNKIWIYNLFFAVCGLFLIPFPMWAIIVGIALLMSFWLMSTSPGQNVSNSLFEHLSKNSTQLASAAVPDAGVAIKPSAATPAPSSVTPPPSASSMPNNAATNASPTNSPDSSDNPDGTEDEVFARLKKLAELRDAGAINEADFEAKKLDLLSRI